MMTRRFFGGMLLGLKPPRPDGYAGAVGTSFQSMEDQIQARHDAAHNLASPIRSVAILADLLTDALQRPDLDAELLRELSGQLVASAEEATKRLKAFATELDD